jgi:hypothetical protein
LSTKTTGNMTWDAGMDLLKLTDLFFNCL